MAICFAFVLVVSLVAVAQDASQSAAKQDSAQSASQATSISGKVSDDGKAIVDKDGKSWTVSNPDTLKGHEGHEVTVQADVDSTKNEVRVESVKMGKEGASDTTPKQ
jgi:membrane protein implicated in regulation of membrane protease activity